VEGLSLSFSVNQKSVPGKRKKRKKNGGDKRVPYFSLIISMPRRRKREKEEREGKGGKEYRITLHLPYTSEDNGKGKS